MPYLRSRPYFGALIGRYANRIAGGRFTLDGETHELPVNDGPGTLHGGDAGFHVQVWDAQPFETAAAVGVTLSYAAADGEGGFPGTLPVTVAYALDDRDRLRIDYAATTDRPTVVNLTSHAYWNLAGEGSGSIDGQRLRIGAGRYTPVDDALIPTGALAPVAGTPMDFRRPRAIGRVGYDHNWVLDRGPGAGLVEAAVLQDPASGRVLTVATDQPGIQVYSGGSLDGTLRGHAGRAYGPGAGLALETQHFPDSPNRPRFPSTVLRPGEAYRTTTVLGFSLDPRH
jgi:aldose 1-epimerase